MVNAWQRMDATLEVERAFFGLINTKTKKADPLSGTNLELWLVEAGTDRQGGKELQHLGAQREKAR